MRRQYSHSVAKPVKVTCPRHGEYEDFPEVMAGCDKCAEEREAEEVRKVMLDAIDEFKGGSMATTEKELNFNTTIGCAFCDREFEIFMNYDDFQDWSGGKKMIQEAMPYMPQEMQQLLITRKCPICSGTKTPADFGTIASENLDEKCGRCGRYRRDCVHPLPRKFMTKKGEEFWSDMTDEEAKAKLIDLVFNKKVLRGEFAIDIAIAARDYKKVSDGRMVWVHKLVIDYEKPKEKKSSLKLMNMERIFKMFEHAKQHLKYPKIRLDLNGTGIALSMAGDRSKFPGTVVVKTFSPFSQKGARDWNNSTIDYLGRIGKDGQWMPSAVKLAGIEEMLRIFAEDPEGVAAAYGRLTGHCCFCHLPLSDPRSTEVGYGQTCAGHWGLKWGN